MGVLNILRQPFRIGAVLLSAIFIGGCSAGEMLSAMSTEPGIEPQTDVAYGPDPRQRLDVYRNASAGADAPVVMFVYGGSWDSGERSAYGFVGNALSAQGFTVVIPDYRIYPQVTFPAFVQDAAAALAYVRQNISGGRPVHLVGHSAGAQIAALLALDPRYLKGQGLTPCGALSSFVGISGPYDFLPLKSNKLKQVFPEALRADSQPLNFARGTVPRSLLIHGTGDGTVSPRNSIRLGEALRAAGNASKVTLYDGVGHVEIVGAFASMLRGRAPTLHDTADFIRSSESKRSCG